MPEPLFDRLCQKIESLFFCYLITREPTKNFERSFARWSSDLRNVKDDDGLDAFLAKYFAPDLANRSAAFDFAFDQLSEYRIQQYRMRYILARLSQYIDETAWATTFPLSRYYDAVQIEHVLPQNPPVDVRAGFDRPDDYDSFRAMLGNLTLLEKGINASVSNGSFAQKRSGYTQSNILLTKSLVKKPQVGTDTQLNRATEELIQFDTWDSQAIGMRQELLKQLAHRAWEIPVVAATSL